MMIRLGPRRVFACRYAMFALVCLLAEACGRVRPGVPRDTGEAPFMATAYCTGRLTASGSPPASHTVAADPAVLPLGTRVRISGLDDRYDGTYVVRDTGGSIRGRRVDLYMRDCREAVRFGRRSARVSVIR